MRLILLFILLFSVLLFQNKKLYSEEKPKSKKEEITIPKSQNKIETNNDDEKEFEEFKKFKKKKEEEKVKKEKEDEYNEFLEYKEYQKKRDQKVEILKQPPTESKLKSSLWNVQFSLMPGYMRGNGDMFGSMSQFAFLGEYNKPSSNFSYRGGFDLSQYYYRDNRSLTSDNFIFLLNIPIATLAYFSDEKEYRSLKSINTTNASFLFNYHFQPRSFFDPYLTAGFGVGSCDRSCNSYKLMGGGGYRIHFEEFFFLNELLIEKPYFNFLESTNYSGVNSIFGGGIKIGIGFYQ